MDTWLLQDCIVHVSFIPQYPENKYSHVYMYKCFLDPYVKVNMMCEGKTLNKWKSSVKKNTLIPVFNESFQFDTSGLSLEEIVLQVRLMDYDRFSRDDQIGTILIGETVEQELGREHWEQVMESPHQPVTLWHPVLPAPPQD